jgi:adenylate cyclase class IV
MPTNNEIKARVDSLEKLLQVVASLADSGPVYVAQDDTFFSCPNGRLKLRVLHENHGVLGRTGKLGIEGVHRGSRGGF